MLRPFGETASTSWAGGQKVVITRTVAASLADAGVALLCPDRDCDRGRL
ncbi:hypothetical protein MMSP_3501 [Mycobacterium sp. 012931]|nr:hypothetical protein MMSP_3501 [Mycobacterium sp. 012931]